MTIRTALPTTGRVMHARILALALAAGLLVACNDVNAPNLNSPSQNDYATITDRGQVQNLVTGIIAGDRGTIGGEITFGEIMGRDLYELTSAEPRYVTNLLGPVGTGIDPSGFIGRGVWPYGTIKLTEIGLAGVAAAGPGVLSDAEKSATEGVIQTLKALEYMRVVEMRDTAGAPISLDTGGVVAPPVHCKPDILNLIAAVLDSGAAELAAGGSSFPFELPAGFADFSTPQTFLTFNRGLAAKADIYRAYINYAANKSIDQVALDSALVEVNASYLNATDPTKLNIGPAHTYSTSTGDALNGLFADSSSTTERANPRVVTEADPGDKRVARDVAVSSVMTGGQASGAPVSSPYIYLVYSSPTTPQPILPNKELILMKAEILWGQGQLPQALALSNFVRVNDGGLSPVSISDPDSLLTEILKQKRYSLLYLSADRWIDARMFGRLDGEPPAGIGLERGFQPITNIPIPSTEVDAHGGKIDLVCTTAS
ncbi:MAG TPA: hypothetical protein VFW98_14355 [Gemmatimonadaceae bacterium]|nr:hypothetical protein [Gemmatimonadaceae bacterium]